MQIKTVLAIGICLLLNFVKMQFLVSASNSLNQILFEENFCHQTSYLNESEYAFKEDAFGKLKVRVINLGRIIIVSGKCLLRDTFKSFYLHEEEGLCLTSAQHGEFKFISPCHQSCPFLSGSEHSNCRLLQKNRTALEWGKSIENSFVNIFFSISYFEELVNRYPQVFEKFYHEAKRKKSLLCKQNIHASSAMNSIIQIIDECKINTSFYKLNLEMKTICLLNSFVEHISDHTELNTPQFCKTNTDISCIKKARELLLADIKNPPPIKQLARLVGINEFKLKKGFKELYQNTIYGTLFDYRMQHAHQLLKEKELTISHIADQIGYSHAAHFINAFKKKFGTTPNKFRTVLHSIN